MNLPTALMEQAAKVNAVFKERNSLEDRVKVSREHLEILESELALKEKLLKREERVYAAMINATPDNEI